MRSLFITLTRDTAAASAATFSTRDSPGKADVCSGRTSASDRCSCSVRTASTRLAVFEKSSPVQHVNIHNSKIGLGLDILQTILRRYSTIG